MDSESGCLVEFRDFVEFGKTCISGESHDLFVFFFNSGGSGDSDTLGDSSKSGEF